MSSRVQCHLPLAQGVRRRATLRRVVCQAAGPGDDQAPPASFSGWAGLSTNKPERGSGPPRREPGPRRGAAGRQDSGAEEGDGDGEWSPRQEQAAARRSLTWDERGAFVEQEGPRDSQRAPESRAPRERRPAQQNTGRGGGPPRQFGSADRPLPRRSGPPPPRGGPVSPASTSGAARRVAEKELRDSRAGGGGQSREQRKAPFRLGASAAPKPRGPREDSVVQLREREASLAALPLPLPLASKAHPFRALGLSAEAAEDLQTAGVTRPTPIQQLAIPELVQGVSAAVLAETGSGKTLAYCLPLATRLYAYAQLGKAHSMRRVPSTACPEALIIVPNRELGVQVAASARAAAAWCQPGDGDGPGTRPLCVVTLLGKDKMSASAKSGGGSSAKSTAAASLAGAWGGSEGSAVGDTSADGAAFEAADIVIATPRTVLQLQKAGRLRLGRCRTVVLDEADELLSAGFVDDVATVVRSAAGEAGVGVFGQSVQLVCVAATLSRQVWDEVMKPTFPVKMARIATEGLHRPTAGVIQRVVLVHGPEERAAALLEALKDVDAGVSGEGNPSVAPGLPALIFTNSTVEADAVAAMLQEAGLPVAAYHGKVQGHRGELLDDLQEGQLAALVVTDMAARGLDLPCVRNVVQWRPAPSPTLHLHRLGRTGRASAQGPCQASVLVDKDDAVDAAAGATPTVLYASTHGWDAVGELIDTRRRE